MTKNEKPVIVAMAVVVVLGVISFIFGPPFKDRSVVIKVPVKEVIVEHVKVPCPQNYHHRIEQSFQQIKGVVY